MAVQETVDTKEEARAEKMLSKEAKKSFREWKDNQKATGKANKVSQKIQKLEAIEVRAESRKEAIKQFMLNKLGLKDKGSYSSAFQSVSFPCDLIDKIGVGPKFSNFWKTQNPRIYFRHF